MIDKLQEIRDSLVIAYNIGEQLLSDDQDQYISHYIPIILDAIRDLEDIINEANKPKIRRR